MDRRLATEFWIIPKDPCFAIDVQYAMPTPTTTSVIVNLAKMDLNISLYGARFSPWILPC
jgi:hypothetical protein